MLHRDKITEATLEWCNKRRKEKGLFPLTDLPKGEREDPKSCPCGAATGLHVDFDYACEADKYSGPGGTDDVHKINLPPLVETFVRKFDQGAYPLYDLSPGNEEDDDGEEW